MRDLCALLDTEDVFLAEPQKDSLPGVRLSFSPVLAGPFERCRLSLSHFCTTHDTVSISPSAQPHTNSIESQMPGVLLGNEDPF